MKFVILSDYIFCYFRWVNKRKIFYGCTLQAFLTKPLARNACIVWLVCRIIMYLFSTKNKPIYLCVSVTHYFLVITFSLKRFIIVCHNCNSNIKSPKIQREFRLQNKQIKQNRYKKYVVSNSKLLLFFYFEGLRRKWRVVSASLTVLVLRWQEELKPRKRQVNDLQLQFFITSPAQLPVNSAQPRTEMSRPTWHARPSKKKGSSWTSKCRKTEPRCGSSDLAGGL